MENQILKAINTTNMSVRKSIAQRNSFNDLQNNGASNYD